jgi:hypothetical protein
VFEVVFEVVMFEQRMFEMMFEQSVFAQVMFQQAVFEKMIVWGDANRIDVEIDQKRAEWVRTGCDIVKGMPARLAHGLTFRRQSVSADERVLWMIAMEVRRYQDFREGIGGERTTAARGGSDVNRLMSLWGLAAAQCVLGSVRIMYGPWCNWAVGRVVH